MNVSIRNKWISFRGSSTVKDLNEKDVLIVEGRFFSFTRKKFIKDLNGNTLYIVRNKFWSWFGRKAFVMNDKEEVIATVRRKIFSLHDHYFIESESYPNLEIRGNILLFDYQITSNGKQIGHVSRKISLRDSYVLTLDDDQDLNFFVALVIAIDNITDRRRENSSSGFSFSSD